MRQPAMAALCGLLLAASAGADAAELKVLSSNGTSAIVAELGKRFESATGHRLVIRYHVAALLQKEIAAGEPFDVVVLTDTAVNDLIRLGKVDAATRTDIARAGIGVAMRAGAAKPDIGTIEAFRQTMLAAKSVAYTPVGGSGIHFVKMLERLGIAAEVTAKAKTQIGGAMADFVARGEADLAVQQISELLPVAGTELVGPFPPPLQLMTGFSAGIGVMSKEPGAARELVEFFRSPDASIVIKSKGMEPNS